ncbi:MAG: hypothetical protein ABI877_02180 [Gemmatimonadaceae bacterium]
MANTRDTAVQDTLLQLNARAWGISFGLLMGGGLFLATAVLVLKGGPMVGQHLNLIGAFFPGYRVTWLGAFLGFIYGFVLGYALGRIIGEVYNRLTAKPRSR